MSSLSDGLPTNVETLQKMVHSLRQTTAEQHSRLQYKERVIEQLMEQLRLARHQRFGASSEAHHIDQLGLFAIPEVSSNSALNEHDAITVPAHRRKRGGRKPLPPELERIDIVLDLSDADRLCPHDGARLQPIAQTITEQLDIVPAQVRVLRHIRNTFACPCCDGTIKTAPMPKQPIPKSLASPGLLAYIAVCKFIDALPLYRQESILARRGIVLSRALMAQWLIRAGVLIQPLITLLHERLLLYDIVAVDETSVQVLKEPGKSAQSKNYFWIQRGGTPDNPIVVFDYDPSRGRHVPLRLLDGYQGYVQTDGYRGYEALCAQPGITQVGCLAHARRKFNEALKAQDTQAGSSGHAARGMQYIQALYRIERRLKQATPEERYQSRHDQAKPILDEMRAWLDVVLPHVPPRTLTGKALNYLQTQWPKLVRYLDDGRLRIDNNLVENAIRPYVVGRKNYLFCDSVAGAQACANFYSLLETARANGIDPYRYLRRVFTELPNARTLADVEALLPLAPQSLYSQAA